MTTRYPKPPARRTAPKAPEKRPPAPRKDPRKALRERFICYALTGAARVDWDPDTNHLCYHPAEQAASYALRVADAAIARLEAEGWFDEPPAVAQGADDDDPFA
jgi:hypothetical protein